MLKKILKSDGVSANTWVIPLIIFLVLLYSAIIALVYEVKFYSDNLVETMNRSAAYQKEIMDMQAGAGVLSETSTNFILLPKGESGALNVGPLNAYANELKVDRRGPKVAESFKNHKVSAGVRTFVEAASAYSVSLIEIQIHAFSLIRSVYELPETPLINSIPSVPLTETELAMTNEERLEQAKSLVLGSEYGSNKYYLTQNATNATIALQDEFEVARKDYAKTLKQLRTALWSVIFALIVLTIVYAFLFHHWLVSPLRHYAQLIKSDKDLKKIGGVSEIRLVANAYNELLVRRNKLEKILRSAAETDALTGLPNRYSLECNVLENNGINGSMAVILFDVNYLKRINDTKGHLAGDKLIQDAAACILESFGKGNSGNCYRIGGDEFVSILSNVSEEEVQSRIDRFRFALERENISVSVGYAYAAKATDDSFNSLMMEADKKMYTQKKQTHEQDRAKKEKKKAE